MSSSERYCISCRNPEPLPEGRLQCWACEHGREGNYEMAYQPDAQMGGQAKGVAAAQEDDPMGGPAADQRNALQGKPHKRTQRLAMRRAKR